MVEGYCTIQIFRAFSICPDTPAGVSGEEMVDPVSVEVMASLGRRVSIPSSSETVPGMMDREMVMVVPSPVTISQDTEVGMREMQIAATGTGMTDREMGGSVSGFGPLQSTGMSEGIGMVMMCLDTSHCS